jgi:hypothetical protein
MHNKVLLCGLSLLLGSGFLTACSSLPETQRTESGGASLLYTSKVTLSPDQAKIVLANIFRIDDIAYRLRVGSYKLCGTRITHDVGLSYTTPAIMEKIGLKNGLPTLGEDNRLTIIHVVPGSAADRAGVMSGDLIESISPQQGEKRGQGTGFLEENLNRAVRSGQAFTLNLRRGTKQLDLAIEPEVVCDFKVEIEWGKYYSGLGVDWDPNFHSVEVKLYGVAKPDDNTLALYISHQAAHGLMGDYEHLNKKLSSASINAADTPFFIVSVGLEIASMGGLGHPILPFASHAIHQMREESEPKADLLSLYMLASSGYDPSVEASMLRKLVTSKGMEGGNSNVDVSVGSWENTGKLTKKRLEKVETETAEIENKRRNGIPLMSDTPELQAIIGDISKFNEEPTSKK